MACRRLRTSRQTVNLSIQYPSSTMTSLLCLRRSCFHSDTLRRPLDTCVGPVPAVGLSTSSAWFSQSRPQVQSQGKDERTDLQAHESSDHVVDNKQSPNSSSDVKQIDHTSKSSSKRTSGMPGKMRKVGEKTQPGPRKRPSTAKETTKLPFTYIDFKGLSCEQILELTDKPNVSIHSAAAIFHLGVLNRHKHAKPSYPGSQAPLPLLSDTRFKKLLAETLKVLPMLDARHLTQLWVGIRDLGYKDAHSLKLLCDESIKKVASFDAHALSITLSSCAKLRHAPGTSFLQTFVNECVAKEGEFTAQGLAIVLSALGTFNYHPGEAVLRALLAQMCTKHDVTAQGVAMCLYGMAEVGYQADTDMLDTLFAVWKANVSRVTPFELSDALKLFAKQHYLPAKEYLSSYCKQVAQDAGEHRCIDLAVLLEACAMFNYQPPRPILQALVVEIFNRTNCIDFEGLGKAFAAMEQLGLKPTEKIMATFFERAIAQVNFYQPQSVARTLNALHDVPYEPGRVLLKKLLDQALLRTAEYQSKNYIDKTLTLLLTLGYNPGEEVLSTLKAAAEKAASTDMDRRTS
eukprot:g27774.t1